MTAEEMAVLSHEDLLDEYETACIIGQEKLDDGSIIDTAHLMREELLRRLKKC